MHASLFLHPYDQNKLQFRSAKYVFIGYNSKPKGYLCLNPSGKVYVAYDVLFNEEEFPFFTYFLSTLIPQTVILNSMLTILIHNPNSLSVIIPTNFWPVSSEVSSTCSNHTALSFIQSSSDHFSKSASM